MKRRRRIIQIISAVLLTAVIVCTSILVIRANTYKKGGTNSPEKIYNYVDLSSSELRFQLASDGKSYKVVGFNAANNSVLPALSGSNDKYRLVIPATYDDGTNGPLPVSAIDISTAGSAPDKTSAWFTSGGTGSQRTYAQNIASVVVPESVQTISVGAFNSFTHVEEMTLPFIGTTRGNTATADGFKSSMYALFGDGNFVGQESVNFDVQTNGNKFDMDDVLTTTGNGKITWYDTTGSTVDYENGGAVTGTLSQQTPVVVPARLKSVTITDEYSVANHAFFMMLPLEKVSIQFSDSIPASVEGASSIGERVFDTAANLAEAFLPDAVSTFRDGVFSFCYDLRTVLPQSKVDAFYNGTLVSNSSMSKLLDQGSTKGQGLVYLPLDGNTNASIPDATFYGCTSIQNLVLSSEVRSIGRYAFAGDAALRKVLTSLQLSTYNFESETYTNVLPSNVSLVNDYAFRSCNALKNMTIDTSLETMGIGVFNSCSTLESLTIPFIGKQRGNGTADVSKTYDDGTQEALFGYIFGSVGSDNSAFKKTFQATTGNPAEERVYAGMQTGGIGSNGATSSGVNVGQVNVPFEYFYIPKSLKNVTITNESLVAIGAFMNCDMIENLQIYSFSENGSGISTSKIGQGALAGCAGLTTLSIPFVGPNDWDMSRRTLFDGRGAQGYQLGHAFGVFSFTGCSPVTQQEPFTTAPNYYYIPDSLTSVELNHQSYVPSYAFWNCSGLETVIIGNETKGMQRSMFKGCTNLTNLTVPFVGVQRGLINDDVYWYFWSYDTQIRNSAIWFFSQSYTNGEYYNPYITDWTGTWICYVPTALKNITVTDESYYETNAFQGFNQVETITLRPTSDYTTMHIDGAIFNGCSNLKQIDLPFIGRDYNPGSASNQAYTIGYLFGTAGYSNSYSAVQSVGRYATTYQIPKTLDTILLERYFTRIADGAFSNMTSLVSVANTGERAANVSYLGSYAFANCYNLQTVEFPKASYTAMGDGAFMNCVSLAKIDEFSPLTVTKIGHHALEGTSVSVVDFSRYNYLGNYAFANCLQLTQVDMAGPDPSLIQTPASSYTTAVPNYTYVGDHLFAGCSNLRDVTLKPTQTVGSISTDYVSKYMFQNCTNLENIVIDNCMSAIPDGFFYGCTNLKDNSVAGSGLGMTANTSPIKVIGANAFKGCRTMQTLALPESLQSIKQGAFQNCSNLDSLRIPRECSFIPYGSDFNQTPVFDDYVSGVFYGCNEDKFYLEVYHPQEDWNTVLQWGQNWNCYFPVRIIGDETDNLFTYEYCPTLKGYLITGLNYEEVDFAPNGNLLLSGTLKFPTMHDGLIVYGLVNDCFRANEFYVRALIDGVDHNGINQPKVHPFYAVDTFILGQNFISMGQGSLNFNNLQTTEDTTVYRTVFSQKTVAQALAATGVTCTCSSGVIHTNDIAGLSYDNEVDYIPNGIVYYKDIWQYQTIQSNGSTITTSNPVFKINALTFSLDSTSFQYQLGAQIKPNIIKVDVNDKYVKYAGEKDYYRTQDAPYDQLYYMFYDEDDNLDLGSFYIKYSNNVNVGRGRIDIQSNNSRVLGSTVLYFDITKRRVDVMYQSGEHPDLYGGFTAQDGYSVLTHFKALLRTNEKETLFYNPNSAILDNLTIYTMEYTGQAWSISNWSTSGNVFGIPKDYVFSGTLSTSSADAGYYMAYNNPTAGTQLLPNDKAEIADYTNVFGDQFYTSNFSHLSGAASIASGKVGAVNGFQWTTRPKVSYRGTDVTSNFEIVVNFAVFIAKRVVSTADEVDWGGYYNTTTGNYEYEYTGSPIVPVPSVIDRVTGKKIPAQIETTVTPDEVIYPTTTPHRAKIAKYDTKNFYIDLSSDILRYNCINFIVVPAKLKINYNCTQFKIDEFGQNFTYDFSQKKAINGTVTGLETLEILKLAPTDYIVGDFHSENNESGHYAWEEGTYKSINPVDGKVLVLDIRILSSTQKDGAGNPVDMTSCYNLDDALRASVKIVYNEFDYDFTITYENLVNTAGLTTLNGVYTHHIPANSKDYKNIALGIENYNESQTNITINFGLDGYQHNFSVKIKNATDTDPTTLATFDDGTSKTSSFTVTDFSKMQYQYTLTIKKDRYYTVTKTVTVTPQKSHYFFGDISKEYDREAVDPLSKILRLPKDFVSSNMSFKFYEADDWFYNTEIDPPIEVGEYKFTATTTSNHSEFFEDLTDFPRTEQDISQCDFRILRRSIYIDVVDDIKPFDSKDYDGLPWEKKYVGATSVTHTTLNLLSGDVFDGFFMSRSAEIGVYDGDVNGDFILASVQPWSVTNISLDKQNQTSNYRIVFRGKYEILPLKIEYSFTKQQTITYDGLYHSLDVTVTKPSYGASIYYSDRELPVDAEDWLAYPTQFSSPGIYTIYFKIEAPHYETVMDSAVIEIVGRRVQYGVSDTHHSYDGFSHGITVTPIDPVTANVGYCLLTGTNNNLTADEFEKLSYSNTCPQVINIGTYQYAIRVSHSNYETAYRIVTMEIENDGIPHNAIVQGDDVIYDGEYHGPIFNLTNAVADAGVDGENLLISYHLGGKDTVNPTWITTGLSTDASGRRYIPVFKEAMSQASKVTVRILLPGYQYYEQEVEVFIRTRSLALELQSYNDVFDNKYHTVLLKLLASASTNATLVVEDKLNDPEGTISYRYYFGVDNPATPDNELYDTPYETLTVRYHNNVSVVANSNIQMLRYKNVCSETVSVYVTAQNCQPQILTGTVVIRFNDNPQVEFTEDNFEIQYLARPVTLDDMPFETNHDGNPEIIYYKASDLSRPISAPKDLGSYKVIVRYPRTGNCAAKEATANFKIVPRLIEITYEDELQYNGRAQKPELEINTFTTDTVSLVSTVNNGPAIEIGDYTMTVGWLVYDPNYTLGNPAETLTLPFKIVPRKLHIVLDVDYERTVPATNWTKSSDWEPHISGLLASDTISLSMETMYPYVDTYLNYDTYRFDPNTNSYSMIVQTSNIPGYVSTVTPSNIVVTHYDDQMNASVADYYDIVFEVRVDIINPVLKVEVNDKTVPYDGNPYGLDIKIITPGVQSTISEFYFVDDASKTPFYTFLETEAGVYKVHYSITTADGEYTAAEGEATLTITKTLLDFTIDPLNVVYDGGPHIVQYSFTNPDFELPVGFEPKRYYFNTEEMKEKKVTRAQIEQFFKDGMPVTSTRIYEMYMRASTQEPIVDAGTYIAVVYFPETANWFMGMRTEEVVIRKRPLYFDWLNPAKPMIYYHTYNGQMPPAQSMGGSKYNEAQNKLAHDNGTGGLVDGHTMLKDQASLAQYTIWPISCEARGEANNPGYEDPYQFDGDFQFCEAYIVDGVNDVHNNYYPVINPITDPGTGKERYLYQIIIKRAKLHSFDVLDTEKEFDGQPALPEIVTPSKGERTAYYYKVIKNDHDNNFADANNYLFNHQVYEKQDAVDVSLFSDPSVSSALIEGWYLVYVTIEASRNYYAWDGGVLGTDYDTDPFNGVANLPTTTDYTNRKYKAAYVKVTPREVDVKWELLETQFDVDTDGKAIRYTVLDDMKPYFDDVTGNKFYINAKIQDPTDPSKKLPYVTAAGGYNVTATLDGTPANPLNYILNHTNDIFRVNPVEYTIHERITEPWLKTYWHKDYTEADFAEAGWIHPDVKLELEVRTRENQAGFFYKQNDFVLTQKMLDAAGDDYSDSVHFNLDYTLYLTSSEIMVEAPDIVAVYDGTLHEPIIDVTNLANGYYIRYDVVMVNEDGQLLLPSGIGDWSNSSDFTVNYKYSYPGDNYSNIKYTAWDFTDSLAKEYAVFKDVGRYRVFYQITSSDVTSEDSVVQKTGQLDVIIEQAESQLYFASTGLDRVYNGLAPSDAVVRANLASGHFNGTQSDLIIKYYEEGTTNEIPAPITVGRYTIHVTSAADTNPNVIKNYTPLDTSYTYEIRKRQVTLVVNANWQVANAELNNSSLLWTSKNSASTTSNQNVNGGNTTGSYEFTILNSFNQSTSDYYIPAPGLVVSDYFNFKIDSIDHLERGTYRYKSSSAYTNDFSFDAERTLKGLSQGIYGFECSWNFKYDDADGNPSNDEDKTENYQILIDFTLVVHYKYMNIILTDQTYDYAQTQPRSPYNNIQYQDPAEGSYNMQTYYRLENEGEGAYTTDVSLSKFNPVDPGTYSYYIKVTADEYEDFEQKTKITIKYRERNKDFITIDPQFDLGKTYDNKPYDETVINPSSNLLANYQWNEPNIVDGEILPSPTTWSIEYFLADPDTGKQTGDALKSVVEAGTYWYRLTIPAGQVYGPTVIDKQFKISPREFKISAPALVPTSSDGKKWIEVGYTGNLWTYDIATNPESYIVERENGGTSGLLPGHNISVGVINSSSPDVGEYTASGVDLYIDTTQGTNFRILDGDGENVRSNYIYVIDFGVRIKKGTMAYDVHCEDEYPYLGNGPTDFYAPYVQIINPADGNQYVEYFDPLANYDDLTQRADPNNWLKTIPQYQDVGHYKMIFRALNVPNYEDLTDQIVEFDIVKRDNVITISDLTREFNNSVIDYPTITTLNLSSQKISPADSFIDSITWQQKQPGGTWVTMSSRPIDVGEYKVLVAVKETSSYKGIAGEAEFKITPRIVVMSWDKTEFEYAAVPQAPKFTLSPKNSGMTTATIMGYLGNSVAANSYSVMYYDLNNPSDPGSTTAPTNVGNYKVVFTFINNGALNFSFSEDSSVVTEFKNFNINKRKVTIKLSGSTEIPGGSTTIRFTNAVADNLPDPIMFDGVLIRKNITVHADSIVGKIGDTDFSNWYQFSNGTNPEFRFKPAIPGDPAGAADLLSNYDVYVDIHQVVTTGQLSYEIKGYEGDYDGRSHSITLTLHVPEGDVTKIEYSKDGGNNWNTELPAYTDASPNPYWTQIKVHSKLYGEVVLGGDAQATSNTAFAVIINPVQISLNADNVDLNKVYDGIAIKNPIVGYNAMSGQDLSAYLHYDYYQKNEITGLYEYIGNNNANVVNAHEYKVVVYMDSSKNYLGSNASDPVNSANGYLEIEFEISKRPISVELKNQQKTFDNTQWVYTVTNAEIKSIINNPKSGLVEGHVFNGTLQTDGVSAGDYIVAGAFKWQNGYSIYDGANEVKDNYELIYNVDVKITKLNLDVTIDNVVAPYNGQPHGLIINWGDKDAILNKLPAGVTDLESMIFYSDNLDNYANEDNVRRYRTIVGTTQVKVRIEIPNYNVFQVTRTITITPNDSSLKILSYPGDLDNIIYNGHPYPVSEIKYELDIDKNRPVTYKFYEVVDGQPDRLLTDLPIEVGKYYVVAHVDAGTEGSAADSEKYYFSIVKKNQKIEWTADTKSQDINGNLVDAMIFKGTNTEVKPEAFFIDVFNVNAPMIVKFVDAQGLDKTYSSFGVGYYYVKAELDPNNPKYAEYVRNYNFTNDLIPFKIIGSIAGDNPEGGDPDPSYVGLEFPTPQGNANNNGADYEAEALLKDNKLYITANKKFSDKPIQTVIYTVDLTTGEVLEINGTPLTSTANMNFHFVIPQKDGKPDIKTNIIVNGVEQPQFTIQAQLKDKINTAWSTELIGAEKKADVADKPILIKIKSTDLDPDHTTHDPNPQPNGTDVPDIIIDPYPTTHLYEGKPITFPLTIHATKGTVDTSDDIYFTENVDYTIKWFKNTGPTGPTTADLASFTVTSIDGRPYSFHFGDKDSTNNADHAGTFTILSSTGDRIQIKETAPHYRFVYYKQDFSSNTLATEVLAPKSQNPKPTDVTRDKYLDDEVAGSQAQTDVRNAIRIGNVYQGQTIADLIENLANIPADLVIWSNVTDQGTGVLTYKVVYDEEAKIDERTALITSGTQVCLYKHGQPHNSSNQLDVVEVVLKGDITGDGVIDISDATAANDYVDNPGTLTEAIARTSTYQAGLIITAPEAASTTVSATIDISSVTLISNHISNTGYDINAAFKPSSTQNSGN